MNGGPNRENRDYDPGNFMSALLYAREKFGFSIFQNPGKLRSVLADLAPALRRDSRIFCRLCEAGLLNGVGQADATRDVETLCAKIRYWLTEEEFMQEERADYYTQAARILCTWTPGDPAPTLRVTPRKQTAPPSPPPSAPQKRATPQPPPVSQPQPPVSRPAPTRQTPPPKPSPSGKGMEFQCWIMDELGIHARPAGLLARTAKTFGDTIIYITKDAKTVPATQLMKLMGLGVKRGDMVTVRVEGGDEAAVLAKMQAFFRDNFAAKFQAPQPLRQYSAPPAPTRQTPPPKPSPSGKGMEFQCWIMDELGIHARPAGRLAKEAKTFGDTIIYITKDAKTVPATQLMKLMGLGVKRGDMVTVRVEGGDEAAVLAKMQAFFRDNFAAEFQAPQPLRRYSAPPASPPLNPPLSQSPNSFECLIMDELGIHARPAGLLAKEAKALNGTTVYITKGAKTVQATQLMKLMGLGVKYGDTVTVRVEGGNENAARKKMRNFFRNYFSAKIPCVICGEASSSKYCPHCGAPMDD